MSRWFDQHRLVKRIRKLERAPCYADDISDLRIDMMDVQPSGCVAAATLARQDRDASAARESDQGFRETTSDAAQA